MTDEELMAKVAELAQSKLLLMAHWITTNTSPAFNPGPMTGEGAEAFVTLMRDFSAFLDEHLPFIDPLILPWMLLNIDDTEQPLSQTVVLGILDVFVDSEKLDQFVEGCQRLAEAV